MFYNWCSKVWNCIVVGPTLSRHPEICYIGEPDYIWQEALGCQLNDVLLRKDATRQLKISIHKRIADLADIENAEVILEKSPSNCFRIPFLVEVFPNAKFIHLIRDGSEVALSASKEWSASSSNALDSKDIRELNIYKRFIRTIIEEGEFKNRFNSFSDFKYFPLYTLKLINFFRRQFLGNDVISWGPKFPGIRQVKKNFSLLETCAIQWERSVLAAENAFFSLESNKVCRLYYEDFIEEPIQCLLEISDFLSLATDEETLEKISSSVVNRNTSKWESVLNLEQQNAILNQISFTIKRLGYN